ncbi:hypothetical protein MFLO_12928 [Listeria floridensis FSL S10-1187]|uniref:Uncharacterized protein n=1 Tax=Listeria floridensis FSL S10-1187 TaxID=1265817 RepID=A0ABP3AWK5_9LIST|nr:hypothetical protein MFLO_12928 [Listeria floridensis FSL S10-1187]
MKRSISEIKQMLAQVKKESELTEFYTDERKGVAVLVKSAEKRLKKKQQLIDQFHEMQHYEKIYKKKGIFKYCRG